MLHTRYVVPSWQPGSDQFIIIHVDQQIPAGRSAALFLFLSFYLSVSITTFRSIVFYLTLCLYGCLNVCMLLFCTLFVYCSD